jgi:hypothetical protein
MKGQRGCIPPSTGRSYHPCRRVAVFCAATRPCASQRVQVAAKPGPGGWPPAGAARDWARRPDACALPSHPLAPRPPRHAPAVNSPTARANKDSTGPRLAAVEGLETSRRTPWTLPWPSRTQRTGRPPPGAGSWWAAISAAHAPRTEPPLCGVGRCSRELAGIA